MKILEAIINNSGKAIVTGFFLGSMALSACQPQNSQELDELARLGQLDKQAYLQKILQGEVKFTQVYNEETGELRLNSDGKPDIILSGNLSKEDLILALNTFYSNQIRIQNGRGFITVVDITTGLALFTADFDGLGKLSNIMAGMRDENGEAQHFCVPDSACINSETLEEPPVIGPAPDHRVSNNGYLTVLNADGSYTLIAVEA